MSDGNPTQLCLHIHSGSFGSKLLDFLVHFGFYSPSIYSIFESFGSDLDLNPRTLVFEEFIPS